MSRVINHHVIKQTRHDEGSWECHDDTYYMKWCCRVGLDHNTGRGGITGVLHKTTARKRAIIISKRDSGDEWTRTIDLRHTAFLG